MQVIRLTSRTHCYAAYCYLKLSNYLTAQPKYTFSFTAGSALISETLVIASEYNRLKDWTTVGNYLQDNNLLNKIKHGTFRRQFNEIRKRLSLLTQEQLELLTDGSLDEAKCMIWLSLVKTYPYFKDFVIEVIRAKYILFDRLLTETDYIRFFNEKSDIHSELHDLSHLMANKVRQVVFRMADEIGLISQIKNGTILKPYLSNQTIQVIVNDQPSWLSTFLFYDDEINVLIQKQ